MGFYNLQPGERILYRDDSVVYRIGSRSTPHAELIITNLNIIYTHKMARGRTKDILVFPLNQLNIYNGTPQVQMERGVNEVGLYFSSHEQHFSFASKKRAEFFVEQVRTITMKSLKELNSSQNTTGKTMATALSNKCAGCHAPLAGLKGAVVKCPYCDTVQTL